MIIYFPSEKFFNAVIEEKCRGTTCFKLNSIMICYRGRGLFTLHVESAAGETNPDETLKKIHSLLRGGKKGNRQLALLQFSFHARENLEACGRSEGDTNFAVSTLDLIVRLIHKFVENNLQRGKRRGSAKGKKKEKI